MKNSLKFRWKLDLNLEFTILSHNIENIKVKFNRILLENNIMISQIKNIILFTCLNLLSK